MKTQTVRKVRNLSAPQRRCLESLLQRRLKDDEEITLLTSATQPILSNGERPSCYDLARKARVIGIIKNAPSDLSTNKKYLEGLGS
jgi:hypothetical protein